MREPPAPPAVPTEARALLCAAGAELRELLAELDACSATLDVGRVAAGRGVSLANLNHYVALRRRDLRPLQAMLCQLGLSSLDHLEPHVRASLAAVLRVVDSLLGEASFRALVDSAPRIDDSDRFIAPHAARLLGPRRVARRERIMVTMAASHALDDRAVARLLDAGMDVARINCAHDSPDVWQRIAANVRAVAAQRGREVRIAMDLAGPKVRTGPLAPGERGRLYETDRLRLTRSQANGRGPVLSAFGEVIAPAVMPCLTPEVLGDVKVGERVLLDDGKLAGVVVACDADGIELRVERVRAKGFKLKPDKGINFPDSTLRLCALSAADLAALAEVVQLADIVALSFCQSADDVRALREALRELRHPELGIVAKIETRQGFEALPAILAALMEGPSAGIMIARGDLAVEVGYERIAELQEEILWLCEAAHMPVIWATQVLESLAKEGIPSRAEITDAAMGERAECVMLNKGPYIADAVRALDDILQRMEGHHRKRATLLRPLRSFG